MGFSQEDESEKPEAAWENPVLVIVRGIKYNESYKMLTGGICMGSYLNPGNEAFAVALNSEIYVDKTGLLTYTNKVMNTLQGYICNSRPRRFGKSITANMLTAYYSKGCSSKEMFSGLEISRAKDFEKGPGGIARHTAIQNRFVWDTEINTVRGPRERESENKMSLMRIWDGK
jgi:hypothetical protein